MTFTISDVRQCAGGGHIQVDASINGGPTETIKFDRGELLIDREAITLKERAILRMRSRVLETTTGNPTPLQVRTSLVGQTFEI